MEDPVLQRDIELEVFWVVLVVETSESDSFGFSVPMEVLRAMADENRDGTESRG